MNSYLSRFFFLGIFIFSFFITAAFPFSVNAAIVPCGRNTDDPTTAIDETKPCTICHLVIGGKKVIDWGLKVMTYVAIAIIVAMAILYIVSTGNEGLMKTAKGGIMAALAGFAVMLGAWLIINTTLRIFTAKVPGLVTSSTGFGFTCDTTSLAGTATSGGGGGGGDGGAACENVDAVKQRLNSGGTVCNNSGSCPSCNTAPFDSLIQQNAGNVPISLIKGLIARESSCTSTKEKTESNGTKSCGLMQVNTAASSYTCEQLKDPETGIKEGMRILIAAYLAAQVKKSLYGNTVTVNELAAAIHNAGDGQSAQSADCNPSTGWPVIPKWGCPINPGSAQFNACAIRNYACNVGACT
jgi:hypothetical protein